MSFVRQSWNAVEFAIGNGFLSFARPWRLVAVKYLYINHVIFDTDR